MRIASPTHRGKPEVGMRPTVRFAIAFLLTVLYVAFAVTISGEWRNDVRGALGPVAAWVIPTFLAYAPGFLIGFFISTILVSRYRAPDLAAPAGPWETGEWPAVTVVIAALDEEVSIQGTVRCFAKSSYQGELEVLLVDNGSSDRTVELAESAARESGLSFRCLSEPEPGKFRALNMGLEAVTTPLLVSVDADTYVHPEAFTYLVARICERPQDQHVSACAGALVVENWKTDLMTRMQSWDYRLGINGVKLMQASYHSTLVAQGALSAYWTEDLVAVGGWPDAITEDIILTWSLLAERGLTHYEPLALATTTVPWTVRSFIRQRARWARGMLDGLKSRPPRRQPRFLARFVAGLDYLVPFLDLGLIFFWVPGIVLFLHGYPLLIGWLSMLVIPVTVAILALLRWWQVSRVFKRLGVETEPNRRGFIGYLLIYQVIASAAALWGYTQFTFRAARRW